jgi:RimJ/RimL family protein N-acetyltransferase
MKFCIETPRLLIRELLPEDDEGMFAMDSDPEVHRYLGGKTFTSIAQSREIIGFVRQQYQFNGIGRWAVVLKETGAFIGWTGFKLIQEPVNGHVNHYDFGYRHRREYWGQGYAFEAAAAALQYGLDTLQFRDVYAMTDPDNQGSRRILEKLGFRLVGIFPYDGTPLWREGQPTTWYQLQLP